MSTHRSAMAGAHGRGLSDAGVQARAADVRAVPAAAVSLPASAAASGAAPAEGVSGATTLRAAALRRRLTALGVAGDVIALLLAYEAAAAVFGWYHGVPITLGLLVPGRLFVVALVVVLCTFVWSGLYELEAWVSRPLHLTLLLRTTLYAVVVTAFVTFLVKTLALNQSRLELVVVFVVFLVITATLRLRVWDRVYHRDIDDRPGDTVVVGRSSDAGVLVSRLRELRGFAQVRTVEPAGRRRHDEVAESGLLAGLVEGGVPPRQVFLDGASLGHKAVLELVGELRGRGVEVYLTGRLVRPLDASGVASRLFELPLARVRRAPGEPHAGLSRVAVRAFDILASGAALVVLSPVFLVCAVAVKLDSPGPVFFRQERVGRRGRCFELVKFRSMTAGNDSAEHRACMEAFVTGEVTDALAQTDEYGRPVYKNSADARVTRVGAVLRKYSLDELPQFWNVFKGEMSVVGPRPALDYEVRVYRPWHELRLEVTPGLTGLWQVAGRSRVLFDDMVFQDVVYGCDKALLTDVRLCLLTLPAMLTSRGAA